ncbi:MAG: ABC transporter permease [Alphaproteobacteria bacterium]|nr:MAG: ABC transporter permease [Alphaproteobacteria bacterium]
MRSKGFSEPSWFNVGSVALGLAFLYLPIALLIIYSFNASRLVTIWAGWSTRWYIELLNDRAMLQSAWVTLRVALLSASAATVLGTLAAIALVRLGRSGMVYAPLVMPEVIIGLSLLLLFVAVGIDRGFWTVAVAHSTLTMCFVTVVVQSRLLNVDRSLEEAALNLGCPPVRTFFSVTLPLIAPALASGWMLAFTLSLDDLIIASFTTGPGATTLPIRIYSEIRLGVKPEINAICTVMLAVVAVAVIAVSLISKLQESNHALPVPGGRVT